MTRPSDLPLLAYDGACGFCMRWIDRWRPEFAGRVRLVSFQHAADELGAYGLSQAELARAIHFVDADGRVARGALAVLRALARVPGKRWMLALYERVPGYAPVAEAAYAFVARHRGLASAVTRATLGTDLSPARWAGSRRLFTALLGAVYALAFGSLWVQMRGLYGAQGILPIAELLERVEAAGGAAVIALPSVFRLGASDEALRGACAAGFALAALAACGVASRWCFAATWLLYLSFVAVGQDFLSFQWDVLLLEAGLLGVLYAPPGLLPRRGAPRPGARPDSRTARWLLRWLLFRVVFLSGFVKLASDDPTWADRSALGFHYLTQPLPNVLAVAASRLPDWAQHASANALFAIELGAPFLLFGPRRIRHAACAAIAALMVLITATGNYGFFTLLTAVLCLAQVDDRALAAWLPRRLRARTSSGAAPPRAARLRRIGAGIAFALVVALSGRVFLRRVGWIERAPAPLEALASRAAPFASFNVYGLFAVMTTERREIEIEGSADGVTWLPYVFRYKPGPVDRAPVFAGAHMPRLDWQMWFAALGDWRRAPWTLELFRRLLEGSPPVRALFAEAPFADAPPRYLRATAYDTTFAAPDERAATGAWWHRARLGPWAPTFELADGKLAIVR